MPARAFAVIVVCAAVAACTDTDCRKPGTICTVAGTGDRAPLQLGVTPARAVNLSEPVDIEVDASSGVVYINDFTNLVVRALDPDGQVRVVLDAGALATLVDGAGARSSYISDLLLDGSGGLYVAAPLLGMVAHVDLATGQRVRVAGTGKRGLYTGDGGPALDAALDVPSSIGLQPDGRLLITDQANQVIRAVDPRTGIIDRFAGRCIVDPAETACDAPVACPDSDKLTCDLAMCAYPCAPGFAGDGKTLDELRLALPDITAVLPAGKLTVGPDGTVFVTDCENGRVRILRTNRSVDTIAGGGRAVLDGALAVASNLTTPMDVAFAYGGVLYIVDEGASCVRRRDLDGSLHTVAGTCGKRGFGGDGGPATEALLDRPMAIKLDPVRHLLYIADTYNQRIRAVALPPGVTTGLRGDHFHRDHRGPGDHPSKKKALGGLQG